MGGGLASGAQLRGLASTVGDMRFDLHAHLGRGRAIRSWSLQRVVRQIEELGAVARWDEKQEIVHLNDELRVSIVLCRHCTTPGGSSRWLVRLDDKLKPDITVAVRMDAANAGIRDYYLLPAID